MNKDLEDYEFKILKMEKRSVLIQNYNISQLNTHSQDKQEMAMNQNSIDQNNFSKRGPQASLQSENPSQDFDK